MNRKVNRNLLIVAIALTSFSCMFGEGHVIIYLTSTHLEDTPAGFWLSEFDLDYSPDADTIKSQIIATLHEKGTLIDEYETVDNENKVDRYIWKFAGFRIREEYYSGGIWRGPKILPGQEYYRRETVGWITIELEQSIPYAKLLPDHHKDLNPDRNLEHAATIQSDLDQERRLFLFGYGLNCQRISLF